MSQIKKANKKRTATEAEKKSPAEQSEIKRFFKDLKQDTIGDLSDFDVVDDVVEPVFERSVGVATNIGISFGLRDLSLTGGLGALLDQVAVANELIREMNNENRVDGNFCKINPSKELLDPNAIDELLDGSKDACLEKSLIYQKGKAVDFDDNAVEIISNILDLISELGRPANPADCINPYFDQFFNLIPLQFLINKQIRDLIKDALEELTEKEIRQTVRNIKPCGAELETIIANKEIPFPDVFPLLRLPAIPTIPNINLYTILRRLFVEAVCYAVCRVLTPLLASTSKKVLEVLNDFTKDELNDSGTGTFRELVANSLEKINLNDYMEISVINEAIKQNKVGGLIESRIIVLGKPPADTTPDRFGLWRPLDKEEEDTAYAGVRNLIRKYFNAIFQFKSEPFKKQIFDPKQEKFVFIENDPVTGKKIRRELGTKEMVYMLLGEYNCLTMADLISIGRRDEFKLLRLNTEERIAEFYKFIGVGFDAFAAIESLKTCPPEPCAQLDAEVVDATQKRLAQLCKILNFKSGLPPIPITELLKQLKLDELLNKGIQQQFSQLRTEYLLFLGFPSVASFPSQEDINPFPPEQTNDLKDFELYTSGRISDKQLFKKFMLRNQSEDKLFWEYDEIDLNKNLKGAKLDDVCGEDETFEQTFAFIYDKIFNLKESDVSEKGINILKDGYKKSFESRVKQEYARRATEQGTTNPCCKYPNKGAAVTYDPDKYTSPAFIGTTPNVGGGYVPIPALDDITALGNVLHGIYYTIGDIKDDVDEFKDRMYKLTPEERCYICRRENFRDGNSLLYYLEESFGGGEDPGTGFIQSVLKCQQFGFTDVKGGNIQKASSSSNAGVFRDGKCPKD